MIESEDHKEFKQRFGGAKSERRDVEAQLRECYKFLFHGRQRDFSSYTTHKQEEDIGDLYTSEPDASNQDFATDICDFYAPDTAKWVEYEVKIPPAIMEQLEDEQLQEIVEEATDREEGLMEALRESNFYDANYPAALEAGHGTMAMWIERGRVGEKIYCEPVPATELFINLGPRGVDDRFRQKQVLYRHLRATFPDATFPEEIERKIKKGVGSATVVWGFWIDWDDPKNPQWIYHASVDSKDIGIHERLGPMLGACPLLVGRVSPEPGKPWGRGPMRKALPDARSLDELSEMVMNKMDQTIDPAWVYPHDGVLDLSQGIQSRTAYPSAPGTAGTIQELTSKGQLDYAFFEKSQMEDTIRRHFFQDGPRQRGDTPPTATQWLDEVRKTQRRMGRPTASLWTEFYAHVIHRFEWLEIQDGRLPEFLTVNGNNLRPVPVSPLLKAQRHDEVNIGRSLLNDVVSISGEMTPVVVNLGKTFETMKERLGDTVVALNTPEQQEAALQQMQPQEQPAA